MKLSRVQIQNFRNFSNLVIDPFPTPAVIVGENGVGKSNLLDALRLVLDPELPDRRRRLLPDDIHEAAGKLENGVEVTISVDITDFDADEGARSELDGAIISRDPLVARLTYRYRHMVNLRPADASDDNPRPLTPDDYEWDVFGGDTVERSMRRVRDQLQLSVLPALRNAEGDLARFDRSPLARLLEQLPPDPSAIEATQKAVAEAMALLEKDDNIKRAEQVLSDRLRHMAGPQLEVRPTLGFLARSDDGLLRALQLFVDAARTRGVAFTSTGTANVLYLALLLETLAMRRKRDAVLDTFLAVEEPEAHLHPGLQRHLFRHLLSEPARLLLTTHSPHIAAVSKLHSLILLRFERAAGSTARALTPGLLTDAQTADVERYLDVTRAEMLFARFNILVEGRAEIFLLPALAAAAGFDLDAYGVIVSSVEGTDFAPYVRLLSPKGFDLPYVVVTDGDVIDGPEPGLLRAAGLAVGEVREDWFRTRAAELAKQPLPDDGAMRPDRISLVVEAAQDDVFVGDRTLEVDIASLLRGEMTTALQELDVSPALVSKFSAALRACAEGNFGSEVRATILKRVATVGKGRYSQRLAEHVERADLRSRVFSLLGRPDDGEAIGGDDLLRLGGSGYLLAALDKVSQETRSTPLFPALERLGEGSTETQPR